MKSTRAPRPSVEEAGRPFSDGWIAAALSYAITALPAVRPMETVASTPVPVPG